MYNSIRQWTKKGQIKCRNWSKKDKKWTKTRPKNYPKNGPKPKNDQNGQKKGKQFCHNF